LRYLALATDYDGTLAADGHVDAATIETLENLRATGRRLILVSGRVLPDLVRVFPRLDLFDFGRRRKWRATLSPSRPLEDADRKPR
jgi:HAD superfamily hydrolase (TIGR01484 family)